MNLYRRITGPVRVLPGFLIVGGQKCGTSSLHDALSKHPCVAAGTTKELAFFDLKFDRGVAWYRAHFPTSIRKSLHMIRRDRQFLTFESTVSYMFHPHAPKRIADTLQDVKIIVMLRNPIERAYSDYNYRRTTWGDSSFSSFEEAIGAEMDGSIAREEYHKMTLDERYTYKRYYRYSYLSRGIYVEQLANLMRYISKDRILVLKSEDFFKDPQAVLGSVLKFLELPAYHLDRFVVKKKGSYGKMQASTRERLAEYFEPYNQRLYDLLGMDYSWH